MANTTRQEILRYWEQGDNNLERFLQDCQQMANIFDKANLEYDGQYDEFFGAIVGFANIIIKTQTAWRKLRNEKL